MRSSKTVAMATRRRHAATTTSNTGACAEDLVAYLLGRLYPYISSVNHVNRQIDRMAIDLTCVVQDRIQVSVQVKSSITGRIHNVEFRDVRSWLAQSAPVLLVVVPDMSSGQAFLVDYLSEYGRRMDLSWQAKVFDPLRCTCIPLDVATDAGKAEVRGFIDQALGIWKLLQSSPGSMFGCILEQPWGHLVGGASGVRAALLYEDLVALVESEMAPDDPQSVRMAVSTLLGRLESGGKVSLDPVVPKSKQAAVNARLTMLQDRWSLAEGTACQDLVRAIDVTAQLMTAPAGTSWEWAKLRVPIPVLRYVEPILLGQNRGMAADRLLGALSRCPGTPMATICLIHALRYILIADRVCEAFVRRTLESGHKLALKKFHASDPALLATLDGQFLRTRAMVGDGKAETIQRKIATAESAQQAMSGLNQAYFYASHSEEAVDVRLRMERMKAHGQMDFGFYSGLLRRFSMPGSSRASVPSADRAAELWRTFRCAN
jgi:hypothetical protein